ncbi:MAG: hypothetical protein U9Q35_13755 [Pseudomonadota bacterium]|jgi:hypothetical protein|nr:hypothetical protein [Pseudomonadota bacterium]
MAANIVLVSRFPIEPGTVPSLRDLLNDDSKTRYLIDVEQQEILQLRAYKDLENFAANITNLDNDWQRFSGVMVGDVRRELLQYVEAPKPTDSLLPDTDYIQLRHVEVLPQRMQAYRQWREETIFDVVRRNDEVDTFLAYHSLISGQPGVMFIAGFSGDPAAYQQVFSSSRYKDIVQQAGTSYITGGNDGLYTRLYVRHQAVAA